MSPLGGARAAAPAPSPGAALPAPSPGTREPPSSIFCAVSAKLRGSWSFCSTIYRLRQHCEKEKAERWPLPLPSLRRLLGEKSPSTRPKYTARQPPARLRPPARRFPLLPARARALPTPSRARPGKPAPRGSAPSARLRGGGGGCLAQLCAQLVGSGRGPGAAHSVGTRTLVTRGGGGSRGLRLLGVLTSLPCFRPPPPPRPVSGAPPPRRGVCARSGVAGRQGPDLSFARPLPQTLGCQAPQAPARLVVGGGLRDAGVAGGSSKAGRRSAGSTVRQCRDARRRFPSSAGAAGRCASSLTASRTSADQGV